MYFDFVAQFGKASESLGSGATPEGIAGAVVGEAVKLYRQQGDTTITRRQVRAGLDKCGPGGVDTPTADWPGEAKAKKPPRQPSIFDSDDSGEQHLQLTPVAQSKAVILYGPQDRPEVNGKRKEPLTRPQYDVVLALIRARDDGLTKDQLDEKSKHGDARKIMGRLADNDDDWKAVLLLAGITGGRYRIK